MIDIDVERGLINYARTVLEGLSNPIPIKMPGRIFQVPSDDKYFEVFVIQNDPPSSTWGEDKDFQGFLRILLHSPNNDSGSWKPKERLMLVAEYFKKGQFIFEGQAKIKFSDHPTRLGDIENGQRLIFPLSIPYRCFYSAAD